MKQLNFIKGGGKKIQDVVCHSVNQAFLEMKKDVYRILSSEKLIDKYRRM